MMIAWLPFRRQSVRIRFVKTLLPASKARLIGKLMCVRTSSRSAAPANKAACESWKVLKKLPIIKCYVSFCAVSTFLFSPSLDPICLYQLWVLGIKIASSSPPTLVASSSVITIYNRNAQVDSWSHSRSFTLLLTHPHSILFAWHENINFIHSASHCSPLPLFFLSLFAFPKTRLCLCCSELSSIPLEEFLAAFFIPQLIYCFCFYFLLTLSWVFPQKLLHRKAAERIRRMNLHLM